MADVYLTPEAAAETSLNTRIVPYDTVITPESPQNGWVIGVHFDSEDKVNTTDWYNRDHIVLIDAEEEEKVRIRTSTGVKNYYRFGRLTSRQFESVVGYVKAVE